MFFLSKSFSFLEIFICFRFLAIDQLQANLRKHKVLAENKNILPEYCYNGKLQFANPGETGEIETNDEEEMKPPFDPSKDADDDGDGEGDEEDSNKPETTGIFTII